MKSALFTHVWGRPGITPAQRYEELWNQVEVADRIGLEYAFSVEHHCTPQESWMTSPMVFGTGVAARTKNIRFGPFGWVPPLRHPLHLVEDVATLDQISGGRLEVGIASGVSPEPFAPFGADFGNRKALTTEAADLLIQAFGNDGKIDFDGPHHSVHGAELSFGAVQKPHPPIWIPTTDRKILRYLAGIGGHTGSTMIIPRKAQATAYRHYVNWFREQQQGADPNIGYWSLVHVAETDEQAEAQAAESAVNCFVDTLSYAKVKRSGEQVAPKSDLSTPDILQNSGDFTFLMDNNLIFVGSAQTVADRIRAAAAEGHFNVFLGEFAFGDLAGGRETESMERYGADVVPLIKDFSPFPAPPAPEPAPERVPVAAGNVYGDKEQQQVADRLEALGYIE